MRRVEKRVYDTLRLRDHLLSLRLILRIGKFRAIEKRSRFYNARFETGLEGFDLKLVTSILNEHGKVSPATRAAKTGSGIEGVELLGSAVAVLLLGADSLEQFNPMRSFLRLL
jgi:hypothetical protein